MAICFGPGGFSVLVSSLLAVNVDATFRLRPMCSGLILSIDVKSRPYRLLISLFIC